MKKIKDLSELGLNTLSDMFKHISNKLDSLSSKLKKLDKADNSNWSDIQKELKGIFLFACP